MKLKNETKWSTDDLRAIIAAALKHRGVPNEGSTVIVRHLQPKLSTHGHYCTGVASIGRFLIRGYRDPEDKTAGVRKVLKHGRWMLLRIPAPDRVHDSYDVRVGFARVVEHEVAHLAGLDHKHMGERLYACTQDVSSWLGDLPLRATAPRAPDIEGPRLARVKDAEKKLAVWQRKLALAKTKCKQWERKLRARERSVEKLAAGRSPS